MKSPPASRVSLSSSVGIIPCKRSLLRCPAAAAKRRSSGSVREHRNVSTSTSSGRQSPPGPASRPRSARRWRPRGTRRQRRRGCKPSCFNPKGNVTFSGCKMPDTDLFGFPIPSKRDRTKGYAGRVGAGPLGETCGSCANATKFQLQCGARTRTVCGIVRHITPAGPTSAIKLTARACQHFTKPEG